MLPLLLLICPHLVYRNKKKIRIDSTLIFFIIVLLYLLICFIERILSASARFPSILIDILSISFIRNLNIISKDS